MDTALDTTLNMTSSLWSVDEERVAPFVSVRGSSVQARLAAVMEAGSTGQQEERRKGGRREVLEGEAGSTGGKAEANWTVYLSNK